MIEWQKIKESTCEIKMEFVNSEIMQAVEAYDSYRTELQLFLDDLNIHVRMERLAMARSIAGMHSGNVRMATRLGSSQASRFEPYSRENPGA